MKNKKTFQYLLILDQSGSMELIKDEVMSAFNEQLEFLDQLKPTQNVKVSLCVFNHEVTLKELSKKPATIERLDFDNYKPSSSTALFDAIGIGSQCVWSAMNKKDKLFVVVFTDGMENASRSYDEKRINYLMDVLKEEGHSVVFMCRKEEKEHYKNQLNISEDCMMDFDLDMPGEVTRKFHDLSEVITSEINE